MIDLKETTLTQSLSPNSTFTLEYLKKNLQLIDVCVPSYQKDFMDHTSYKIVFTQQPKTNIFATSKRFNDFVALYDVIKMRFQNIQMKSFPSKFQIFHKSETRRVYFDEMMKRLLKAAKQHQQIRHQVLSMIISFVNLKSKSVKEDEVRDKSASKSSLFSQQQQFQISRAFTQPDIPKQASERIFEKPLKKNQKQQFLAEQGQLKIDDKTNITMMKFENDDDWKKKYLRVKDDKLQVYRNIAYNTFQTQVELYGITVEYLTQDPSTIDQIMMKMEFRDDAPVYPPNYQYLSLYHEYDSQKLLLTTPEALPDKPCEALQDLRVRLVKASQQAQFTGQYKGFFSDTGKVYIALYGFKILKDINSIITEKSKDDHNWVMVKIRTQAFHYETKKVQLKTQNLIKQGFVIPITSVFEVINIQLVQIQMKGWLKQQEKQKVIGRHVLKMSDILSYNRGYNFQKVVFRIDQAETGTTVANMTATVRNLSQFSSIYAESFASQNDGQYINYQEMSIRQTLNSVSLTLDRLLYIFGHIGLFIQTTWRNVYCFKYPRLAIFVLSLIALAFIFLDMSNAIVLFIVELCAVIIYNHKSVYPIVQQLRDTYFTGDNQKHENFITPRILSRSQFKYMKWAHNHIHLKQRIRQKSGESFSSTNNIERQDITFQKTKKFFFLKKGGNLFKIQDEDQGIFDKVSQIKLTIQEIHNTINSFVNVIQKIGSLFIWVDFRRTFYFLIIVISLILISNALAFRFLGVALCVHRYIKGMRYYRKHYARNRKLAQECLKYIINKSFKETKKQLDTKPIYKVLFPIQEESLKKIKQQLQSLIPICINASEMSQIQQFVKKIQNQEQESIQKKTMRKKYLPYIEGDKIQLAFFIDMIQSCESRLKLQRILTNQGRTQQYQNLREVTKERPVIDIWLQDLIKNYILNTPSLFYNFLHKTQDSIVQHQDSDDQQRQKQQQLAKHQYTLTEVASTN